MSDIYPVLRYRDPDAALGWLKKAFGFEEKAVSRGEDGAINHAELRVGDGLIMLSSAAAEDAWLGGGPSNPLASTVSVYIVIDNPESHYERAKAEGATIVSELQTMDYGSTEYSARDPEGNLWSFGTYKP